MDGSRPTGPDRLQTPSLKRRAWRVDAAPDTAVTALRTAPGGSALTAPAARILASRGVAADDLKDFLDPKLKTLLPNPDRLLDMKPAVARLARAIENGERIGVWSDYDCDGISSAALVEDYLRMAGHEDRILRIPDRLREGYGPNAPGMVDLAEKGCSLILTLDSGISANAALAAAREAGADVVVLDHHKQGAEIPPAVAVVDPNREDDTSGQGHLCAAGVSFLCMAATSKALREKGYFDGRDGRPATPPDLMSLLDLVALATVCDVVPLKGVNRAFVRQGLTVMNRRQRPGLAALAQAADIKPGTPLTEKHCGWMLGPRINAAGRIGNPADAVHLLLETDPNRAASAATALDALNSERKRLDGTVTEEAIDANASRAPGERHLAWALIEDGHEGVLGISAGRLREACDAPAIIFSHGEGDLLKGSARSVPGFDIGEAIIAARTEGILSSGGGHPMAAGLSVPRGRLSEFVDFMNDRISTSPYAEQGIHTTAQISIPLADLDLQTIEGLSSLAPFGAGNEVPVFHVPDLMVTRVQDMKGLHHKLTVRDGDREAKILSWGTVGKDFGAALEASEGRAIDIIATAEINEFRGERSLQFILQDAKFSGPDPACGPEI